MRVLIFYRIEIIPIFLVLGSLVFAHEKSQRILPQPAAEKFNRAFFNDSYVRSFEIEALQSAFDGKGFALDPDGRHFYTTKQLSKPNRNSVVARYRLPSSSQKVATLEASVNLEGKFQNSGEAINKQPIWGFDTGGLIEDLKYFNGKLIGSFQHQYDVASRVSRSHFTVNNPKDLSSTTVTGLANVSADLAGLSGSDGTDGGFVAGYMAKIPHIYSSTFGAYTHIIGAAGASGIKRTNVGPAAYGFNANRFDSAEPLMHRHLDGTNILRWVECCAGGANTQKNRDLQDYAVFNNTTTIKGLFFIPGTDKVAFIGSGAAVNQTTDGYQLGSAVTHYGGGRSPIANGTYARDEYRPYQGTHSVNGDYEFQIWVHDVDDLVNGQLYPESSANPESFRFDLGQPAAAGTEWKRIGGVDMDWDKGLLYILEITTDSFPHVVHVYNLRR